MTDYSREQDYSEQELRDMFDAGVAPEEIAALMEQMKMANATRTKAMPGPIQAGQNTVIAASPLEHLATAWEKGRANKEYATSRKGIDESIGRMSRGRETFYRGAAASRPVASDMATATIPFDDDPKKALFAEGLGKTKAALTGLNSPANPRVDMIKQRALAGSIRKFPGMAFDVSDVERLAALQKRLLGGQ